MKQLRPALQRLATCSNCQGSRMLRATAWRGHGVGKCGVSNYDATAFEALDVNHHCTCPDGPLWGKLVSSELGQLARLSKAQQLYPDLEDHLMAVYDPEEKVYCSVTKEAFRQCVIDWYKAR